MNFTASNMDFTAKLWEKYGKRRVYISKKTGFKNRPLESVGHYDLNTSEFVPAHAYNHVIWSQVLSAFENQIKGIGE